MTAEIPITRVDPRTLEIGTPEGHLMLFAMIGGGATLSSFGPDRIRERQRFQMSRHELQAAQALLTQLMQDEIDSHARKGPPPPLSMATRSKSPKKKPTKRPKKKPVKRPRKTR